jgi:hypothetical protein
MSITNQNFYRLDDEGLAGLPNYNYIRLFMEYAKNSDVLPEIAFQNGLSLIEAIALKRVCARTKNRFGEFFTKVLFANQYNMVVAGSGESKTIVHNIAKDVAVDTMGHNIFADCTAPETLKKSLADSWTITRIKKVKKGKKGDEFGDGEEDDTVETKTVRVSKLDYPCGWKIFWHGEFGAVLANMSKTYMSSIKQDFCNYYSGVADAKQNSGDTQGSMIKYEINDVFFGINGATTPNGIKVLSADDIDSGFWVRFNIMNVKHGIVNPDPTDITDEDEPDIFGATDNAGAYENLISKSLQRAGMVNYGRIIKKILDNLHLRENMYNTLLVEFESKAFQHIINHENIMRNHFEDNARILLLRSRQMENIYKMCILMALGDVPYYVLSQPDLTQEEMSIGQKFTDVTDVNELFKKAAEFDFKKLERLTLSRLIVTQDHARFVLKMFDRIYFQSMIETANILMAENDGKNDMAKVVNILQSAEQTTKQNLVTILEDSMTNYVQHAVNRKISTTSDEYRAGIAWHENLIKTVQDIGDDVKITTMARKDLIHNTKITADHLEPIMRTLSECGNIIQFTKYDSRKPTSYYAYIPNFKRVELPEPNYINYMGNGTYASGAILINCVMPANLQAAIQKNAFENN